MKAATLRSFSKVYLIDSRPWSHANCKTGLHDAWSANQTVGPDRKYPKADDVVRTDYFTILARIAIADPSVFVTVMSSFGTLSDVWGWLSTEWFRHFDSMANIDRQKLSCLALTRLLELQPPMTPLVLEKLQDYFAMWTQVIGEMLSGKAPLTSTSFSVLQSHHVRHYPRNSTHQFGILPFRI